MPTSWSLRRPDVAEADALVALVQRGLAGYVSFAPAGWVPPDESQLRERYRAETADPDAFNLAAYADGELVGFTRVVALDEDPTDLRLRHLFVEPPFWGTGLARELHDAAVAFIGDRSAMLFTPALQTRARRFYEREGWTLFAEREDEHFGMPVAQYRR